MEKIVRFFKLGRKVLHFYDKIVCFRKLIPLSGSREIKFSCFGKNNLQWYLNLVFVYFFESQGLLIWELGRDNKWGGTIDEITQLQQFLQKFVDKFISSQDLFQPVPARWRLFCSRQNPGIAGTIFSISILYPRMKNVPPYLFFL